MTTPAEIFERLKTLPEPLQGHNRRFYVEAVTDDTRAPMADFYRQTKEAQAAAMAWAKAHGAEGFYPPNQSWGRRACSVYAFSFKQDGGPDPYNPSAWKQAGGGYAAKRGHVAMTPSKKPAGKAITAELDGLPKFPTMHTATHHLGAIETLRTPDGFSTVGNSDGSLHFSVPFTFNDRYFIDVVNHNYDIALSAQRAAEYLAGDNPEWAPRLDYLDDPIAWRPPVGWAVHARTEVDFLIAEENLRRAQARAA